MSKPLFAKEGDETWRDVCARVSDHYGLAAECLECYDAATNNQDSYPAAWEALYEWDCLPLEAL